MFGPDRRERDTNECKALRIGSPPAATRTASERHKAPCEPTPATQHASSRPALPKARAAGHGPPPAPASHAKRQSRPASVTAAASALQARAPVNDESPLLKGETPVSNSGAPRRQPPHRPDQPEVMHRMRNLVPPLRFQIRQQLEPAVSYARWCSQHSATVGTQTRSRGLLRSPLRRTRKADGSRSRCRQCLQAAVLLDPIELSRCGRFESLLRPP